MLQDSPRLRDFIRFGGMMIKSRDIDPMYPVLAELNAAEGWAPDDPLAYARSLTYVAVYNIVTAELIVEAAKVGQSKTVAKELAPTCGIERRGHRDWTKLLRHFEALAIHRNVGGGTEGWLRRQWNGDPRHDWNATRAELEEVYGNGRWASYKAADILAEVHGWPIEAPDAAHRDSSGPLHGLNVLLPERGPERLDIAELDQLTELLRRELWAGGVPAKMSEVETLLCNWHALADGRYYVGHDIDEMLGQITSQTPETSAGQAVYERLHAARRRALPLTMLGELHGWSGVRKERMRLYSEEGRLWA